MLEALFPAGVWQAAGIENKSATVAGVVFRQIVVEGKTENAEEQVLRLRLRCGRQTLQLFRGQHVLKRAHESRKLNGQFRMVQQPANVFQGIGHALQKMWLALVEAAETVGAKGLHDSDIDEGVVVAEEGPAIELDVP